MLAAEDSLAILQLVARADDYATARDARGYAALFTEDASMEGAMGSARGRAAIAAAVAQVWAREAPGTVHLTLNAVIDESGAQPAVTSTLFLLEDGQLPKPRGLAHVTQTFAREGGTWRIASRRIQLRGRSGG